ncbi:MAG: hypothetical protein ABF608_11045 [Sporolactobacillus sp.]
MTIFHQNPARDDQMKWLPVTKKAYLYDVILSVLYVWGVYEAYVYDAKTRTGGILIYIVVYFFFTLMIRSFFGLVLMNILSALSLLWFLLLPLFQYAGSYFDGQPFLGWVITIFVAILQALLTIPLRFVKFGRKSAVFSLLLSLVFCIALTIYAGLLTPISRY